MKRFALMLVLAMGAVGWGELSHPVYVTPSSPFGWAMWGYYGSFQLPSDVWSHIGDDHAAVPPPVPVVVERPSGFGDCVCDRFTEPFECDYCPFCGRYVPSLLFPVPVIDYPEIS